MAPAAKQSRARKHPSTETEIRVVVNEVVDRQVGKLETSLTKLTDATTELIGGVASQKQRLDYMEDSLKKLGDDKDVELRTLGTRLDEVQRDLSERSQTLTDRIAGVHQELSKEITSSAEKQTKELTTHMDTAIGQLSNHFTQTVLELKGTDTELAGRVTKLEVWRWLIVGGGMIVTAIVTGILLKLAFMMVDRYMQ